MDPRLGTDTSRPGEAAFAVRFDGKPYLFWKIRFQNPEQIEKTTKKTIRILVGESLEMSSL